MKKISIVLLFFLFFIIRASGFVLADEANIELIVDKTEISLGDNVRLDLIFDGIENMPAPELPVIEGFESSYLRSANVVSKSGEATQKSTRHTYILTPQDRGDFKIGPLEFSYDGKRYTSRDITIRVTGMAAKPGEKKEESTEEARRAKEDAFLLMAAAKDKVYINETFPIIVALYYKQLSISEVQYPTLQHEGFSIGEFSAPQAMNKTIKGYDFHVISFRNQAFADTAGNLKLGPAAINCSIIETQQSKPAAPSVDAYKKVPLRLESDTRDITVLPFPDEARPADFMGAVGDFKFVVKAEPTEYVKIGDPITVRMEISGKGNLDMIYPPSIKEDGDFTIYEPHVKEQTQAYKIFEQTIIPKSAALTQIPQISFSFFNPEKTAYVTLMQGPTPIKIFVTEKIQESKIIEQPQEQEAKPEQEEPIGRDIIYIKDTPGRLKTKDAYLYKDRFFLWMQIWPVFLYLSTLILYRRYERFKNDINYARYKLAYKKANPALSRCQGLLTENRAEEFYSLLFGTIQHYLGDKFGLPSYGITADIVDNVLKPKGFNTEILEDIRVFFKECDIARFTPSQQQRGDMQQLLNQAKNIVEYFKRR